MSGYRPVKRSTIYTTLTPLAVSKSTGKVMVMVPYFLPIRTGAATIRNDRVETLVAGNLSATVAIHEQ
jgi:hypothetical protein